MADFRDQGIDPAIKGASAAAVATDLALVVALSPNSPIPAGANTIGSVNIGIDPDTLGSGTITAADAVVVAPAGNGVVVSGASTAGSYVSVLCPGGDSAWNIQLTGTFGGTTVYWEESVDSTTGLDGNWIAVNGRQTGVVNTMLGYSTTTVGYFRGNTSGSKYLRARAVGGATISISVVIRMSSGVGAVFLNASVPSGGNIIGKTGIDQTTPGTTNLVALSPETTKVIGTVNIAAAQTVAAVTAITNALPTGANVIGALTANQSVNTSQIGGITPLMGNGVTGTGSQRVTIASDNTAFPVNSTLSAETTKVIGTVNVAAAQTLATVTTVGAVTAITNALPTGANTIGAVNIAAAQTLSTVTTVGAVTAITNALPAGANVIGTVNVQGLAVTGTSASIAAAGTGTIGPLAVVAAGNVTFTVKNTVAANAYAGNPVLVFEQSDDNSQWGPMSVSRSDTNAVASTFTLAPNTASASLMFNAPLEGVAWIRCRVTTGPVTNAMTVVISPGGLPFTPLTSVINQPVTKGTQGTTGVTTQDLKDAGRNAVHYYMLIPVLTSATDTLQSLTGTKAGATVATTTTPAVVTAGKTFRVTRVAATYIATATSGYGIIRLRFNTAGVVAITSPIAATICIGSGTPATANATGSEEAALDEGWEFAAATGVGISVQGFAAVTATAVGYVMVSITGYEY